MEPKLLIFLFVASFSVGATTASSLDNDLAMLNVSCVTLEDRETMTYNILPGKLAKYIVDSSSIFAISMIAITELRQSLQIPPLPPWHTYNHTVLWRDKHGELQSAATIEEYYGLKERVLSKDHYLQNEFFDENIDVVVSFFDKKYPVIRRYFQETAQNSSRKHLKTKEMDRKSVDRIVEDYEIAYSRIRHAVNRMTWKDCPTTASLPWDDSCESPPYNTSSPAINMDDVLLNINSSCLYDGDIQKLTGNKFRSECNWCTKELFQFAVQVMAIQEMRATLEFDGDQFLKKYYLLKERQVFDPDLDINLKFTRPYISYLDSRFPMLRFMYQQKFRKVVGSQKIDVQIIDRLMSEYRDVVEKVKEAIETMLSDRVTAFIFGHYKRYCKNGTAEIGTEVLT